MEKAGMSPNFQPVEVISREAERTEAAQVKQEGHLNGRSFSTPSEPPGMGNAKPGFLAKAWAALRPGQDQALRPGDQSVKKPPVHLTKVEQKLINIQEQVDKAFLKEKVSLADHPVYESDLIEEAMDEANDQLSDQPEIRDHVKAYLNSSSEERQKIKDSGKDGKAVADLADKLLKGGDLSDHDVKQARNALLTSEKFPITKSQGEMSLKKTGLDKEELFEKDLPMATVVHEPAEKRTEASSQKPFQRLGAALKNAGKFFSLTSKSKPAPSPAAEKSAVSSATSQPKTQATDKAHKNEEVEEGDDSYIQVIGGEDEEDDVGSAGDGKEMGHMDAMADAEKAFLEKQAKKKADAEKTKEAQSTPQATVTPGPAKKDSKFSFSLKIFQRNTNAASKSTGASKPAGPSFWSRITKGFSKKPPERTKVLAGIHSAKLDGTQLSQTLGLEKNATPTQIANKLRQDFPISKGHDVLLGATTQAYAKIGDPDIFTGNLTPLDKEDIENLFEGEIDYSKATDKEKTKLRDNAALVGVLDFFKGYAPGSGYTKYSPAQLNKLHDICENLKNEADAGHITYADAGKLLSAAFLTSEESETLKKLPPALKEKMMKKYQEGIEKGFELFIENYGANVTAADGKTKKVTIGNNEVL